MRVMEQMQKEFSNNFPFYEPDSQNKEQQKISGNGLLF